MDTIYIIGHKNPDVDSICSALAYADFKKRIGAPNFQAARCGNSNARIDRVLEKFSVALPRFVGDVRMRTKDVMNPDFIKMRDDASCFAVMDAIDKNDIRTIPILDADDRLQGEVSVFDLGEFFIPHPKSAIEVRRVRATLGDVVKTLNAQTLCVFAPDKTEDMYVRIGAMEVATFGSFIERENLHPEQNLIVVGDRFDIQIKAVRMATRALPMMRRDVAVVGEDLLLSKVAARAREYFGKTIYVCDADGKTKGLFSSTDLLNIDKPKLVLVDHNELTQAVTGAEECDIVEIIDHHRLGMTRTVSPILFLNKPVGSTCTIISQIFRKSGIKPDKSIAGLLCSGIICDTLNMKSPTTTEEDVEEAAALGEIIGESADALSEYIFSGDSVITLKNTEEIITSDCKSYKEGDAEFSVSQIEELDFTKFYEKIDEIREALEKYREKRGLQFSALFVTNVMTQDSLLMISGGEEMKRKIGYARDERRDLYELPKIVSRKKQLIPYIIGLLRGL